MKSNEYLMPKRRKVNFSGSDRERVDRVAVDYGVAIFRREFDGFGRGALGRDYEDFEKGLDVDNDDEKKGEGV